MLEIATLVLDLANVTYEIEAVPEIAPIEGNVMVSGDDEADRECEAAVAAQLEGGNQWAWCTVRVSAVLGPFRGTDCLGCCSYKSQDEFTEGGYYEDMQDAALADLRAQIIAAGGVIETRSI